MLKTLIAFFSWKNNLLCLLNVILESIAICILWLLLEAFIFGKSAKCRNIWKRFWIGSQQILEFVGKSLRNAFIFIINSQKEIVKKFSNWIQIWKIFLLIDFLYCNYFQFNTPCFLLLVNYVKLSEISKKTLGIFM